MKLDVDGGPVFLADQGKGFHVVRPTVLFVHGAGMDSSVWPLQARHFAYRGYNALAVDLPGHGRSGGKPLRSIDAMSTWLWQLIQALQLRSVTLVGHSMGALACLETAAAHRKKVTGLALLGAAPKMPVHPDLLLASVKKKPLAPELICDWGFGPAGHFGGHKAPGSWMLGHALRLLSQSAGPRLRADLTACNDYANGLEAAARLRCPTLVIAGELDRMTPAKQGARLAVSMQNAEFVSIPECGHMMMVERPDATLDALAMFARHHPAAA